MTTNHTTPLPLTGGSNHKPTLVQAHLDWLEVTFQSDISVPRIDYLSQESIEVRPFKAYDRARKFADGRVELWNTVRQEMGFHIIFTGDVLDNYRYHEREIAEIYEYAGGKFSRVDVAVDVFNDSDFKPSEATKRLQLGECRCRSTKYPLTHDAIGPGYTQYFGAPSSEVRVRMYDKAAEKGVQGDWTRVEAQYRAKRANQAVALVTSGADMRAVIRGFVDFPEWAAWKRIFSVPLVIVPSNRQDTNTMRWLIEQCAPALARQVSLRGDDFLLKFYEAYNKEYEIILRDKCHYHE